MCAKRTFLAPKGQLHDSPGQSATAQPRSAALGYRSHQTLSPEGALHPSCASPTLDPKPHPAMLCPFRAISMVGFLTQGGAPRLHRYALPWADMLRPLRGEEAYAKEAVSHPTSTDANSD